MTELATLEFADNPATHAAGDSPRHHIAAAVAAADSKK